MKDQTRNIETFKVGATRINEFDFHKHQREMHEHDADDRRTYPVKAKPEQSE
jgi:hypothetical protein